MTDYYQTLGVNRDASQDDIKRAYRGLASKHHPDKGGDTVKFQEIQAAYATLSEPQKKEEYDNPKPQFHGSGGGMPPGMDDIFAQMFGGGNSPFGDIFGRRPQPVRNRNLNLQTQITLEEAFTGKELIATIQLPSGRNQVLEVKIPAGVSDGVTLRLAGMGDDSIGNTPRGDIMLSIHVMPHTVFYRKGDDLVKSISVNCLDAIIGAIVQFDTIDRKTLDVTIAPGTQHGQTLAVQGYGMPNIANAHMKGRLLLNINITVPTNLTDNQKVLIKEVLAKKENNATTK
jgi:DnaJ-class molecular chaperone